MAKTTLEIPDPLLRDAKKLAASEGTTLRALVEQGLRKVVADTRRRDAASPGWLKALRRGRYHGRACTSSSPS